MRGRLTRHRRVAGVKQCSALAAREVDTNVARGDDRPLGGQGAGRNLSYSHRDNDTTARECGAAPRGQDPRDKLNGVDMGIVAAALVRGLERNSILITRVKPNGVSLTILGDPREGETGQFVERVQCRQISSKRGPRELDALVTCNARVITGVTAWRASGALEVDATDDLAIACAEVARSVLAYGCLLI